jgi:hypothetical protein
LSIDGGESVTVKLATTVNKISLLHNSTNASLLTDLHQYMKNNWASDSHQNNCLKTMLAFASFIGPNTSFYDIKRKDQVIAFLNTKLKTLAEDPDRKCITTWNDYLGDIKYFFRWLHNQKIKEIDECKNEDEDEISQVNWETPIFVQVKKKRTKRLSPYSSTQIWDLDELLAIVKYEPSIRNKAALTLFWDLNGRNHEITTLKVGNIRLRERYGEGEYLTILKLEEVQYSLRVHFHMLETGSINIHSKIVQKRN